MGIRERPFFKVPEFNVGRAKFTASTGSTLETARCLGQASNPAILNSGLDWGQTEDTSR
jgi:hypothetical protein